jgi:hypothetical protein
LPRRKQTRDITAFLPHFVQEVRKVLANKERFAFLSMRNFAVAKNFNGSARAVDGMR